MDQSDFNSFRKTVFSVLKGQLDSIPQGSVNPVMLVEKLSSLGVSDFDGVKPIDYLNGLATIFPINTSKGLDVVKELKKWTVRRELVDKCDEAKAKLVSPQTPQKPIDEIVGIVDKALSDIGTKYYQSETDGLFDDIIEIVEDRGNNPINPEEMGFMGPFASINRTIGSCSYPGAFTVIAARAKAGKSTISFFYNVFLAEKYNLPVLHLDAAEMTKEQLQMRAVCCLSAGRIPLWAVKSGEWRKNKEWVQIIRDDIWPRVKKIKFYYKNIGEMNKDDFVSYILRFYYKNVGRDNHLLINWDYIKGVEAIGKQSQEYQAVGYMVNALKHVITEEIEASVMAGVQTNRSGTVTGKQDKDINDSEDVISLSDRISQMATNLFILRFKTPEMLSQENNNFGNMILKSVLERELLGKHYEELLVPVKMPDGRMVKNYFNLQSTNFHYKDLGTLAEMNRRLGLDKVIIDKHGKIGKKHEPEVL